MNVEKTIHNSTDDDSTKNSTKDFPFVHVHHDQVITSNLKNNKINYMNFSMIFNPIKTITVMIKPIKRKCRSLRINERSTKLPQFFHSMLDPSLVNVCPYVAWLLCLLCIMP